MTIGIFKGSTAVKTINIGGTSIAQVYAGATKVWPDTEGPLNLVNNNGQGLTIVGVYRVGELATQYGYGMLYPGDPARPAYGTLTGDQKTNVIQQLGVLEADLGESTTDCDFFCLIRPDSPLYPLTVQYKITMRGDIMATILGHGSTAPVEDIYLAVGSITYRYTRWKRSYFDFGGRWSQVLNQDLPALIEYPI